MKPKEVVTLDARRNGLDEHKVLRNATAIARKNGIVLHTKNTTLLLEHVNDHIYACHLFTHDSPLALAKIMVKFFRNIKKRGIHRLYGKANNHNIVNFMKHIGSKINVDVTESDLPHYNWMIEL